MCLDDVLAIIAAHEAELRRRHVATLSVFGSVARGDARLDSDVDLLVEFDGSPVTLFDLGGLQVFLSEILGVEVDLVMRSSVIAELRDRIYNEAVRAA